MIRDVVTIWRSIRVRGVVATVRLLPEYIVDRVRGLLEYPRYYREMERDGFDARYGTETAGIVEVGYGSLVGKKGEPLFRYQTASTFEITQAIGSLLIRHRDFTFVDIGSGKGKVLIVAQEYGFRRSIGVEISEELHRQAQQNIARLDTAAGAIELVCSDIEDFELPDGPTLFYMYNPLSEPLLTRFLARVEDSLRLRPRTVLFVYLNPVFGEVLDRAAFLRRVDTRTRWWSLYHSAPHPIRLRWTSAKPRPDVPRAGILIDD